MVVAFCIVDPVPSLQQAQVPDSQIAAYKRRLATTVNDIAE